MGTAASVRRQARAQEAAALAAVRQSSFLTNERLAAQNQQGLAEGASEGVKIRCNKCQKVQVVPFGMTNLTCDACGSTVWVMLSQVAEQAAAQAQRATERGREELDAILSEQVGVVRHVWNGLEEEITIVQALWDSEEAVPGGEGLSRAGSNVEAAATARTLVQEAFAAQDGMQLEEAFAMASTAGLSEAPDTLREALSRVRREEDLEGLWRCIKGSLVAGDRVDLQFWCDEASTQGLCVPQHVLAALRALQSAEHARLAELQYQADIGERAAEMRSRGDEKALQALIHEAETLGADPSPAIAALSAVQNPAPEATQPSLPDDVGPVQDAAPQEDSAAPEKPTSTADDHSASADGAHGEAQQAHKPSEVTAEEELIRGLSISELKKELVARGLLDAVNAAREKEELVQALLASWHLPRTSTPPTTGTNDPAGDPGGSRGSGFQPQDQNSQDARHESRRPPPPPPPPPPGHGFPGGGPRSHSLPPLHSQQASVRGQALACLGLGGNPSADDIRHAYKRAALRWHPDRRQNHDKPEEAKERFQRVRAAYEFLQAELEQQVGGHGG